MRGASYVTLIAVDADGTPFGVQPHGIGIAKVYDGGDSPEARLIREAAAAAAEAFDLSCVVIEIPLSSPIEDLDAAVHSAREAVLAGGWSPGFEASAAADLARSEAALRREIVRQVRAFMLSPAASDVLRARLDDTYARATERTPAGVSE